MKYSPMQIQRLRNGMTQEKSAAILQISRGYLSMLETYSVKASPEILIKMANLYNCKMIDLFPID